MNRIEDGKLRGSGRDYVQPQLVNYGSIADATGSFIADDEIQGLETNHDVRDR